MPFFSTRRSPSPGKYTYALRPASSSNSSKASAEKCVGFAADPITSVSRPLSLHEEHPLYNFEMHARTCPSCRDPLRQHRNHGRLCAPGNALAQDVTRLLYSRADGATVLSRYDLDSLTHVELPRNYPQARSLLRAVERGARHPRQAPIVSFDRTFHVAPRLARAGTLADRGTLAVRSAPSNRSSRILDADRVPDLTHSPTRRHRRRAHSPDRVAGLTRGLAALAVQSQESNLLADLSASPPRRRNSVAVPADFATTFRLPPEKRLARQRQSMVV